MNDENFLANLYIGIMYWTIYDDPKSAAPYLERAIRISPADKQAYAYLSQIYKKTNQLSEAILLYNRLARLKPNNPKVTKSFGDLYFKAEDNERALENYKKAISIREDYIQAWEQIGYVYKKMGDDKEVLAVMEKLYEIDSSNNILVRGDIEFLNGLTKNEFVALARSFQKTYSTSSIDKVWINNVSLVSIAPDKYDLKRVMSWMKPYTVNIDKVARDLEIALYAQYRVIQGGTAGIGSNIKETIFDNDETVAMIQKTAGIDGVFGFKGGNFQRGDVTGEFDIEMLLVTAKEAKRFRSEPMRVKYLTNTIFVFNKAAALFYGLALLVFGAPFSISRPTAVGSEAEGISSYA